MSDFFLPELQMNMIVTTPYSTLPNITPNKKYIISRLERDILWVKNDYGDIMPYKAIHFIEADVFFALCLYMTFMRMLNLTDKPLDSLNN
jgi:hypothetical protein